MVAPQTENASLAIIELTSNWNQHLLELDLAPRTVKFYLSDLARFLAWLQATVGDLHPTYTDIAIYRDHLLSLPKSTATVNRAVASMRVYMEWAVKAGVAKDIGRVKSVRSVASPRPSLTRAEGIRLVHALGRYATLRDRALVMLMLGLGLRASEVAQLTVGDIDIGPRHIDVQVRAERAKGRVSRKVRGLVNTRDAVMDRIGELEAAWISPGGLQKDRRASRDKTLALCERLGRADEAHLPDLSGVRLIGVNEAALAEVVRGLGGLAGVKGLHPHMLRRTYGQALRASGRPIEVVARNLGHRSINTTVIYTMPQGEDWDVLGVEYL